MEVIGLFYLILSALYLLPSLVAGAKQHKHFTSIFLLNLGLGFTIFGWIFAIVWAFEKEE